MNETQVTDEEVTRFLATFNDPAVNAEECFRKPELDAMDDASFASLALGAAEEVCGFSGGEPDDGGAFHLRYVNELRRRLLTRDARGPAPPQ